MIQERRQMEDEKMVEEFIAMLEEDRALIHEVLPKIQDEQLKAFLSSEPFREDTARRFQELDKERKGFLRPDELYPVIIQLCRQNGVPLTITLEHCERFSKLFDRDANGVVDQLEFLDFATFLIIMSYLSSQDPGVSQAGKPAQGGDQQRISTLLAQLREDAACLEDLM